MKFKQDLRVFSLSPSVYKDTADNFRVSYARVETPAGPGYMAITGGRLIGLFLTTDRARVLHNLENDWKNARLTEDKPGLQEYSSKLFSSADGRVDLLLKGTDFQVSVWKALCKVETGRTTSYLEIAERLNQPKAVRAVANAVGANPIAFVVPCHRVIRSDGTLGGYAYGIDKKRQLLKFEGAQLGSKAR